MNACKLAVREYHAADTRINIATRSGNITIGKGSYTIIAGPCAVESRDKYLEIALQIKEMGAQILRGGAYKPRTSPYAFPGMGLEGLKILAEAREVTGLPVVTEVMDTREMDTVCSYCDMIQIGSRSMQNFPLLREAGKCRKPVILKRGLAATIEEWLLAAEYIMDAGNPQVILCERGIRTFEMMTRNTIDIGAVALLKELSHLPVIVDPSHATGKRSLVKPVALAGLAAGADGLMVEVHQRPDEALSDGPQSLTPEMAFDLMTEVRNLTALLHK